MEDKAYLWTVIVLLGLGTWLIRFSFLGLIGDKPLPTYFKQMLNYTAVAVLPGLAAPVVLQAPGIGIEPARIISAVVILGIGIWTQNMLKSIAAGLVFYFGLHYLMI